MATAVPPTPSGRRWPVVVTLLLLAPTVAEVLSGSTPVTGLLGLVFFIPMYGAGALLIREVARRRRLGWAGVILLGAAFGLVEEGLVVQAVFHPQAIEAASWGTTAGGHVGGVYGVFAVAVVAYHAIWSIALPILLVDLLFPAHRAAPLLGSAGLFASAVGYLGGLALVAALVTTRIAPGYGTAPVPLAAAGITVIGLVVVAGHQRVRRGAPDRRPSGTSAPPWVVGGLTMVTSFAAMALLMFVRSLDAAPRIVAAVVAAGVGSWVLRRLSTAKGWGDEHRLAVAAGLLLVSPIIALAQAARHSYGNRTDRAGLVALEILAVIFVAALAHLIHRRNPSRLRMVPEGLDEPGEDGSE